jgi:hypothetical protein
LRIQNVPAQYFTVSFSLLLDLELCARQVEHPLMSR